MGLDMSLDISRRTPLPIDIDQSIDTCRTFWSTEIVSQNRLNSSKRGEPTMPRKILSKAAIAIREFYDTNNNNGHILETFAGNGAATRVISDHIPDATIHATDLVDLSEYVDEKCHPVEFGVHAVDAVEKYGSTVDTLMMITPPPSSDFADYFAIRAWERAEIKNDDKYLIFVGELGASDGSDGLYDYLIHSPVWKIACRKMLFQGIDILGGPCEKELFIFVHKVNK